MEKWRKQGWPGALTPENSHLLHVARLWFAYDSVELAQQVGVLDVTEDRLEGLMIRLGMGVRYWRERADRERQNER